MQFEVRIGERRVMASGQLVLLPTDRTVTFTLEGMSYVMSFTPTGDPGPFQVHFDRKAKDELHVDTRGLFPAGTVAWTYAGILQFDDADIDLELLIHSDTAAADSVRRLAFTFSARPKLVVLDPTAPTPAATIPAGQALRGAGSAPPSISIRPS